MDTLMFTVVWSFLLCYSATSATLAISQIDKIVLNSHWHIFIPHTYVNVYTVYSVLCTPNNHCNFFKIGLFHWFQVDSMYS